MSAGEDEAELVRRIKAEEIATYRRARGPLTPREQAEGAEALADFQERMDSGWYGRPDGVDRDLARLRRSLDEED